MTILTRALDPRPPALGPDAVLQSRLSVCGPPPPQPAKSGASAKAGAAGSGTVAVKIDEYVHSSVATACMGNAHTFCDEAAILAASASSSDSLGAMPIAPICGEALLLREDLAQNLHDLWALRTLRDGWRCGAAFDMRARTHPHLRPFGELPAGERAVNVAMVAQVLESLAGRGFGVQLACDPRGTATRVHEMRLVYAKASKGIKSIFGF